MAKNKIEIVEIDLTVDIEKEIEEAAKDVSENTQKLIDKTIEQAVQKRKQKEDKEAQQKEKEDKYKECLSKLTQTTEDNPISSKDLLEISGCTHLAGLINKLKNSIPNDKELSKVKIAKQNHYFLK